MTSSPIFPRAHPQGPPGPVSCELENPMPPCQHSLTRDACSVTLCLPVPHPHSPYPPFPVGPTLSVPYVAYSVPRSNHPTARPAASDRGPGCRGPGHPLYLLTGPGSRVIQSKSPSSALASTPLGSHNQAASEPPGLWGCGHGLWAASTCVSHKSPRGDAEVLLGPHPGAVGLSTGSEFSAVFPSCSTLLSQPWPRSVPTSPAAPGFSGAGSAWPPFPRCWTCSCLPTILCPPKPQLEIAF